MQQSFKITLSGLGLLIFIPGTALGHSQGGAVMGGAGGVFGGWGLLWPVLFLVLVALLLYGLVGGRSPKTDRTTKPVTQGSDKVDPALEKLRQRYARGDISEEEFDNRRRTLKR